MNTTPFSTTRQQAAAGMLAITLTLSMLLGVNGLAAHGSAEAQQMAAAAAQLAVAAPAAAASGV